MSGPGLRKHEISGGGQGWTTERRKTALDMAKEGHSASQIAAAVGGGLSRNAVIGLVNRAGLTLGGGCKAASVAGAAVRRAKAPTVSAPAGGNPIGPKLGEVFRRAHSQSVPTTIPFVDRTVREGERPAVSMLQLQSHHCKWPIGDPSSPDFGFCGARMGEREPYCDTHAQRAFVAIQKTPNEMARSLRRHYA